nr:hypothetical protein [Tolivirales sp.]
MGNAFGCCRKKSWLDQELPAIRREEWEASRGKHLVAKPVTSYTETVIEEVEVLEDDGDVSFNTGSGLVDDAERLARLAVDSNLPAGQTHSDVPALMRVATKVPVMEKRERTEVIQVYDTPEGLAMMSMREEATSSQWAKRFPRANWRYSRRLRVKGNLTMTMKDARFEEVTRQALTALCNDVIDEVLGPKSISWSKERRTAAIPIIVAMALIPSRSEEECALLLDSAQVDEIAHAVRGPRGGHFLWCQGC